MSFGSHTLRTAYKDISKQNKAEHKKIKNDRKFRKKFKKGVLDNGTP